MSDRARRWLNSDLIGIPVTILAVGIVLLSILAIYIGPVRGLIFSAPVLIWGLYLTFKRNPEAPDIGDIEPPPHGDRHRLLVVANRGLDSPALCEEVCRRAESRPTDVMIIVLTASSSLLRTLADDFDEENREAIERLERTQRVLADRGVEGAGHIGSDTDPMSALVDGLREFPADEVVMLSGAKRGWEDAEVLGERIRREIGVAVTEVDGER